MCGFMAQLVEHCTGIAEVTGSNPVEALSFFQASLFQFFKLEIHCDDHYHFPTSYLRKIYVSASCLRVLPISTGRTVLFTPITGIE